MVWSVFLLLFTTSLNRGARFLFVPAHNIISHTKSMTPFAQALAKSGHQVTIFQLGVVGRLQLETVPLVEDVTVLVKMRPSEPFWMRKLLWTDRSVGPWLFVHVSQIAADLCAHALKPTAEGMVIVNGTDVPDVAIHKILRNISDTSWDLVFVDSIFAPCGVHFALRNANFIDYSTTILFWNSIKGKLIFGSLAVNPGVHMAEFNSRIFSHRLTNFYNFITWLPYHYYLDMFVAPYSTWNIFQHKANRDTFYRESIFTFRSVPQALSFLMPLTNGVLTVDYTCPSKDTTTLPDKYRKFVEDSKSKGSILVAFGHYLSRENMPEYVKRAMEVSFSNLSEYRIIWQSANGQSNESGVSHILRSSWVPQAALLAHPKTLTFVTHMGYKSFREALCNRIPVVALPVFAEQYLNTAFARRKKIAVYLDKCTLTKESLIGALDQLLTDRNFSTNIQKLAAQVDDIILPTTELAEFWIHFYLRHSNVIRPFLRQKGAYLSYFQLYNIDVVSAGFIVIYLIIFCILK